MHLALSIAKEINRNIKIVNIPCWELFEQQSKEYKDKFLLQIAEKEFQLKQEQTFGVREKILLVRMG